MRVGIAWGREPAQSAVERLGFVKLLQATSVNERGHDAEEIASRRWPTDRPSQLMAKAAASPGAVSSSGWSAELAQTSFGAFLQSLQPYSAMAPLILRGTVSPLERAADKSLPYRSSTPAPWGWCGENEAIPITVYTMAEARLSPRKMAIITVISKELTRYSDAEKLFSEIFRQDAGQSLDSAYFSTGTGTTTQHAGLLYDVIPVSLSGGDPLENLAELSGVVAAGGSGEVSFVTSPERAARFRILHPDSQVEMLPSAAVPSDRVIALAPRGLVHGADGLPDIDTSEQATLHMNDTPLPLSVASTVAHPQRSLWQTGGVALRCIMDVCFVKRRANAVAFANGIPW